MKYLPRLKTNSRIMTFRNTIGNTALTNVQSYLARYTQDQTESYVQSAVMYHGEIPFLYRVFEPTDIPVKTEKGGYKVVSARHPPWFARCPHYHRRGTVFFNTKWLLIRYLSTTEIKGLKPAFQRPRFPERTRSGCSPSFVLQ